MKSTAKRKDACLTTWRLPEASGLDCESHCQGLVASGNDTSTRASDFILGDRDTIPGLAGVGVDGITTLANASGFCADVLDAKTLFSSGGSDLSASS